MALRRAGDEGQELFVLWSGVEIGEARLQVRTIHIPEQTSYQTSQGLLVRVEAPALHRLNMWLYENQETLFAQVHSHPSDAFHSETDDAYPIVTTEGSFSIVVPDFCQQGILSRGTASYRLRRSGWVEQPSTILEVV